MRRFILKTISLSVAFFAVVNVGHAIDQCPADIFTPAGIVNPKFTAINAEVDRFNTQLAQIYSRWREIGLNLERDDNLPQKFELLYEADQSLRAFLSEHEFLQDLSGEDYDYFDQLIEPIWENIDKLNLSLVKRFYADHGWPVISKFGEMADKAVWHVVQHSVFDREFQKLILVTLEGLYPIGETHPRSYPHLYDRLNQTDTPPKPQRYGSHWRDADKWILAPVEDIDRLNEYRQSVGLKLIPEDVIELNRKLQKERP